MFSTQKRVFAGKQNLQAEPFCPFLSDQSGYLSLRRKSLGFFTTSGQPHNARPSIRDGKHRV